MTLTPTERDAVATICLLAAFADGRKDDAERDRLKAIFSGLDAEFSPERLQRVLMGQADLEAEAAGLTTPVARTLAYEMAVAVCDADGQADDAEQAFLDRLRAALALDGADTRQVDADAQALAAPMSDAEATGGRALPALGAPPAASAPAIAPAAVPAPAPGHSRAPVPPAHATTDADAALDAMVLRYAVLNGGLELLPQTLATLAIVPMQTKMVYRIGLHHGHELGPGHVKELLATVGLGLTSQVVESYARGLFGGLAGGALGKALGGKKKGKKAKKKARKVVGAATGAAFSFAATYALGKAAQAYYGGGRQLAGADLRGLFDREVERGHALYQTHRPAVEEQARTLDLPTILAQVRAPLGAPDSVTLPSFTAASPRSHGPLTE